MRRIFLILALWAAGGICRAESGTPIRLAIVSEETALSPAADFLTAELSKDGRLALLEREQIAKVLDEQALALAAGGSRDYLKIGELLGADGLLILTLADKEDRQVVSCRLVAVKPGVELGLADYDFPLSDPEQWSKLLAGQFAPLLSKLTVLRQDAVPISILNLRSAAASAESEALERELTLLLHDRLMTERDLFVLERRSMETLTHEKEEKPVPESPFWNGSYLIEGTIDPRGFNSNQVTVDIQITPPDKKNVIALEVCGARSNLTQVINDMALRIAGTVSKGSVGARWSADDEAERYYEEAKWMLRWGMSQEAKAASEAAWALGKQTREAEELRIKAYQACAGDPGLCVVMNGHVIFIRLLKEGIGGINGYGDFAIVPDAGGFSTSIRAAELWLDGLRNLAAPENKPDSSWYDLGATSLEQCSWWLRYYYFNAEARAGAEDDIRRARQLCREMSQTLAHEAEGGQAESLLRIVAKHEAFWAETPEETLRGYHELLDKGEWPALRKRFFNDDYKEVSALRQSQGYAFTTGHKAHESADPCSPCLAGWDWDTRQRCPELWSGFIDELCASPKPTIQLEGLILRCSYAWSDADFKGNLSRLEDFIREQFDTLADAGLDENLAKDLQTLMDIRVGGLSVEDRDKVEDDSWNTFKRELQDLQDKRGQAKEAQVQQAAQVQQQSARAVELKGMEHYLQTQTNFDFMSFAKVLLDNNYNAEEAKYLLPLVTNYHERIKNIAPNPNASDRDRMMAQGDLQQAEVWIGNLEDKLKAAISPPPPSTNVYPAGSRPQPRPTGIVQGAPQSSPYQYAGGGNRLDAARNNPPIAEKPLSSIKSVRFWKLPAGKDGNGGDSNPSHIVSECYRDGKLWIQAQHASMSMDNSADFYGVDLKTFTDQHIEYNGDPHSFFVGMVGRSMDRRFEVDSNYLYLWMKDSVSRYSFQGQTWVEFAPAGDGKPQRLGNRLFFTSPNSIREYLADGTFQLLASCRRRPAETALDNMDNYAPCHLFLDAKGRINVCASNELYALSGSNDWQQYATVPTADYSVAALFDDGFILPLYDTCWGMFGPCQKPELLFLRPSPPGRVWRGGLAAQEPAVVPKWSARAETTGACLDGDCIWIPVDPSQRIVGRGPGYSPAPSGSAGRLALVRCKYGEPDPMRIAVDLPQPESDPGQIPTAVQNNFPFKRPSWQGPWFLTATPEGLTATRRETSGFWFIAREDLNQAVAEAYARHATMKAATEKPTFPPANP